ncbi:MAG TPA: hypothetical protein VGF99_10515, partial [Myxococcota bacterium]
MAHTTPPEALPGALPPARATAWTIVGFVVVAALLSALPGIPDELRPLRLDSDKARRTLVTKVFARPKMTLAEHERGLEGSSGAAAEDGMPPDDHGDVDVAAAEDRELHDESRAAADL